MSLVAFVCRAAGGATGPSYIFVHDNSWQSPHQIAESATGLLGLFVDPVRLRGRVSSMRTRFWTALMVKVIHANYELP